MLQMRKLRLYSSHSHHSLLSDYYVLGSLLVPGEAAVNTTDLSRCHLLVGETDRQQRQGTWRCGVGRGEVEWGIWEGTVTNQLNATA